MGSTRAGSDTLMLASFAHLMRRRTNSTCGLTDSDICLPGVHDSTGVVGMLAVAQQERTDPLCCHTWELARPIKRRYLPWYDPIEGSRSRAFATRLRRDVSLCHS